MRMMGAESVEYHRATVLGRGDDYPGMALEYYASRGETPLVWGGSGRAGAGPGGSRVAGDDYEAVFGPGGARHPRTGERLVSTRRPGHGDRHLGAQERGRARGDRPGRGHAPDHGRRARRHAWLPGPGDPPDGRAGGAKRPKRRPTGGLIYAHTRHATSRAGDPCPHDHVLLANLVEMKDEQGGWKAADTALWREHLHAATMVGRVAAARVAVELGYAIEADPGPSGRLGHWRIAGVPDEVMELHSKRAAEIEAECQRRGEGSYRARAWPPGPPARPNATSRWVDLVERWRAELAVGGLAGRAPGRRGRRRPPAPGRARPAQRQRRPGGRLRGAGRRRRPGPAQGVLPPPPGRGPGPAPVRPGPRGARPAGRPGPGRPRSSPPGRCGRRPGNGALARLGPGPGDRHRREPGPPVGPHRRPRRSRGDGRGSHRRRPSRTSGPGCQKSSGRPPSPSALRGAGPSWSWGWPGPARPPCCGPWPTPSSAPATK